MAPDTAATDCGCSDDRCRRKSNCKREQEPLDTAGAGYVRRTGTTSPEVTEDFRVVCRHCKAELPALGDHTCPCPFSDEECPDHG